ncbi:GH36-type glycosyl hydrolase domain-containing protein [Paenibacillus marinisediminis]
MTTTTRDLIPIQAGNITFTFMESGDIRDIMHGDMMVNQVISNPLDGSMNNIYLRIHRDGSIHVVPMVGIRSKSEVRFTDSQVIWEGEAEGIRYTVTFTLTQHGIWFWDVAINGDGEIVDVIYGQDIGLANKGAVRNNESYVAQYVDHAVYEHEQRGYAVCSRQNQPQSTGFPYMQQGALTKVVGYSTDGFQFFGLSYKETNEPEALTRDTLNNEVYQYEFAYTALQSERIRLHSSARFVFYGLIKPDHPLAIASLEYGQEVLHAWEQVDAQPAAAGQSVDKVTLAAHIGAPLRTEALTSQDLNRYFPRRCQEEWEGEELLSFFTETHEHVVLKAKELRVERPHGHILMTGHNDRLNEQVLTTTSYMYGLFNAQVVVGNTSFNKWMSNARNALNVMKTSGQRIYVEQHGTYRLLTMPSMFEMGFNYARWYYKTEDDMLVVTNFTALDTPELQLHVRSESGISYRFIVTNQITMNSNEYDVPYQLDQKGSVLSFHADASSESGGTLPHLCYRMDIAGADGTVADETVLANHVQSGSASLVVLQLSASHEWKLMMQGLLKGEHQPIRELDAETEISRYRAFYKDVMNGFHLSHRDREKQSELDKFNSLAWWYTHNMLVHYSVPHGLEQYSGAAWGTRDVCQGPTEYFMATQKYDQVREIIKTVFAHQFEDDGNWPQWFMFDHYWRIQQNESHGDIIVWPLKVLSDYVRVTGDYSILQEEVPYSKRGGLGFTETNATLLEHANKEIEYIKQHFLHDTHLSSYGDGDWDDTLQPANAKLKQYMASSWTVALTYQVFNQLSEALVNYDEAVAAEIRKLASGIREDFNRYMLPTGVIPGFVYMEEPGQAELMVHPTDTKTGIQYRLLPMTRSMISELLTEEQAEDHYQLIKRELFCPDGVRLMNRPAHYEGGVSTHFKRAEQAANFGREIGLQYVHAHIRYIEAMAKLGKVDEVWNGLHIINPVGLRDAVPNAELRQRNAYFSSSDGKFNTRYEAQSRFGELREGSVPVKGGWRIYSSGPGIYMNQLISNCLGIRQEGGDLVIDPVLPRELEGLQFQFTFMGHPVQFEYHLAEQADRGITINGQEAASFETANRYRQGGMRIKRHELDALLTDGLNVIAIYM